MNIIYQGQEFFSIKLTGVEKHAILFLYLCGGLVVDLNDTQVPELKEKLIEEILKEMKGQGLSQNDVGKLVGMDRRNVNKTLRGTEKGIALNQLVRIANGIGLRVDLIVKKIRK